MKGWVGPPGLPADIIAYHHDRMRAGLQTAPWQHYLERAQELDGYADGVAFQAAIAASLGAIEAALAR